VNPFLLVLRVSDLEVNVSFYSQLGLSFQKERHGKGPVHYAAEFSGMVFELYPCRENESVSNVRFGIKINNTDSRATEIKQWVENESDMAYFDNNENEVLVVTDPDKRKIDVCFER